MSTLSARERAIRALGEIAPGMDGYAEDFVDALLEAAGRPVRVEPTPDVVLASIATDDPPGHPRARWPLTERTPTVRVTWGGLAGELLKRRATLRALTDFNLEDLEGLHPRVAQVSRALIAARVGLPPAP